VIASAVA